MSNVTVFWTPTDKDEKPWIAGEFLAGRLRQGWAAPGSSLVEEGQLLPFEEWAKRYSQSVRTVWNTFNPAAATEHDLTRKTLATRYRILRRLVDIQVGDLVVVPRMPSDNEISIVRVERAYIFRETGVPVSRPDFGHVLEVDTANRVQISRGSAGDEELRSKFRSYRSAITAVKDPAYIRLVRKLFSKLEAPTGRTIIAPTNLLESPPERVEVTTRRIKRDAAEVAVLKKLYRHTCQACGLRIETPLGALACEVYAEVHHLRPLGGSYKGIDHSRNMLVLCPNCHAQFDLLSIAIEPKTMRIESFKSRSTHSQRRLYKHPDHQLEQKNIIHHWNRFLKAKAVYHLKLT